MDAIKKYQRWFSQVEHILGMSLKEFLAGDRDALTLKAPGYMDLHVDRLNGRRLSLAHNFIQNGDVMADPDMEVMVDLEHGLLFPLTFQQDSISLYQEVYAFDDKGEIAGVRPKLRASVESFFGLWLRNLQAQGHKLEEAPKAG